MVKRIWAGHALSPSRFSVSIGELDDENPFSRVVVYEEGQALVWGHVDLPRTIVSIADGFVRDLDRLVYMPLSNEGDVYQLYEDIPFDHIEGAGVFSDDASDFGSTLVIRKFGETIYVAGNGSQVYRRETSGAWSRIGSKLINELGANTFTDIALDADGRTLAVVGYGRVSGPTPTETQDLERFRKERNRDAYNDLRKLISKRNRQLGCAYIYREETWFRAATIDSGDLTSVLALGGAKFLCGGIAGSLTIISSTEDAVDVSISGFNEDVNALAHAGDGTILALFDTTILTFDADLNEQGSIELPPGLTSPFDLVVAGDTIWYFDHAGVARYRNKTWEIIEIPIEKFS